jgi:hypothetical protein
MTMTVAQSLGPELHKLDVLLIPRPEGDISVVANAKGRGHLATIIPDYDNADCWEQSPNNMYPAEWLGSGIYASAAAEIIQVANDNPDAVAVALAKAMTRLNSRVLVFAKDEEDGNHEIKYSSACPVLNLVKQKEATRYDKKKLH